MMLLRLFNPVVAVTVAGGLVLLILERRRQHEQEVRRPRVAGSAATAAGAWSSGALAATLGGGPGAAATASSGVAGNGQRTAAATKCPRHRRCRCRQQRAGATAAAIGSLAGNRPVHSLEAGSSRTAATNGHRHRTHRGRPAANNARAYFVYTNYVPDAPCLQLEEVCPLAGPRLQEVADTERMLVPARGALRSMQAEAKVGLHVMGSENYSLVYLVFMGLRMVGRLGKK